MICHLWAKEQGFGSIVNPEYGSWEPEEQIVWVPVQGQEKMRSDAPTQLVMQEKKKEWIPPSSTFCSIWALNELDDVHAH